MMVRWKCGYSERSIWSVRVGMIVSACRNLEVVEQKCVGRSGKTLRECVNDDMKRLGL